MLEFPAFSEMVVNTVPLVVFHGYVFNDEDCETRILINSEKLITACLHLAISTCQPIFNSLHQNETSLSMSLICKIICMPKLGLSKFHCDLLLSNV